MTSCYLDPEGREKINLNKFVKSHPRLTGLLYNELWGRGHSVNDKCPLYLRPLGGSFVQQSMDRGGQSTQCT